MGGAVRGAALRGNLLVRVRLRRRQPALVRCPDSLGDVFVVRADGRGHELWNRSLHDSRAIGGRVSPRRCRWQPRCRDCTLVLLQAIGSDRHNAALQGTRRVCLCHGVAERVLLLARKGWHVCRTEGKRTRDLNKCCGYLCQGSNLSLGWISNSKHRSRIIYLSCRVLRGNAMSASFHLMTRPPTFSTQSCRVS